MWKEGHFYIIMRLLWLTLLVTVYAQEDGDQIVETSYGQVRGTHDSAGGYTSFLGIPYATVQTGQNRYLSPLPPPSWDEIFEANQNDILCPQILNGFYTGIENCLTLNIFKPDEASSTEPLPVMVYIHGGSFSLGSNSQYTPDHLMSQGIVLVIINYRLGPLGFLCLGHELVPGNTGFKDQVAALRWIQENISVFGGDQDSVTIIGQSAGGASVDLLSLSPLTAGLFNRAISMSGTSLSTWAINENPIAYATEMAETYLNYEGNNIDDLVQLYLETDAEELAAVSFQYFASLDLNGKLPFAACIEDLIPGVEAFLTATPANILTSGDYDAIPIIYTVTNKEYVNMVTSTENINEVTENMADHLPSDLNYEWNQDRTAAATRVLEYYFNDDTSDLVGYIDFRSDTLFYYSVIRAAKERQALSSEPVYVLEFTYESELRLPRLAEAADIPGVGHADDLYFLIFPTPEDATLTEEDQLTIDRYILLFTNFAKYGNPTPEVSSLVNQEWQPVQSDEFHYLELGSAPIASLSPHEAAMALWEGIYAESQLDRPIVQTTHGLVRGTHDEDGGFSSFTGIRYAQAPTGQYRFTDPLPASSWDDIFDANQNDIYCPQFVGAGYRGTEDCLTLNVFVPDTASTTNPLAVIVFVHGGSYVSGSNSLYGPNYLMERDVVLVTINFRVGLLGLLCLGHELAPGNAAFKDQIAALRWVQGNIAAFGGDPNSVTILGHSSGAASVDLLTLSPLASGLFTQAVSLSASSRAIWAVNPDPIGTATTLAQRFLSYEGDSIDELVQVYLDADPTILALAATQDLLGNMDGSLLVGACVEEPLSGVEPFLTDTPANILATGAYTPVPIIYGVTSREYLTMITDQEILDIDNMVENIVDYIPADLAAVFNYQEQRAEFAGRVREFYVTDERSNLESYIDYVSDSVFYYGIVRAARERQATSSAPVYFLEFAYESWLRLPRPPLIDDLPGVGHGDDLLFLIVPLSHLVTMTPNDQLTINRYSTLIANFAKFGNPTPQVSIELDQQWQQVYEHEFNYLILDTTVVATLSPHEAAMTLWENIYTEALLDRPIVQTAYGLVRGTHDEEGVFSSFTGIRYAQAPTGQLRFTDPLPASSWDGIFDANQNDIYCPQSAGSEYLGTEDCLTLNVFVPDTASTTNPLAVIVFIHGGAYVSGSNSIYGPDYLMERDVVLVTINFRVGLLGLLCLGHELAPGNVAFKDQIAALRWVQGNIAAFGGDPNSVTILGHSSGAASVDLLTLSPLASGLFTQAVSLSASSRAIWAVNPDPIGTATTLAQRFLNYDGDSIDELVQVYIDADLTILALAASQDLLGNMDGSLLVGACVEDPLSGVEPFLTDTPANILATGAYTPVPIIYGVTSREYLTMISEQEILDIDNMIENLVDYIPADLSAVFNYQEQRAEFVDRVRQYYVTDERSNLESYIDYVSDGVFYYGIVRAARERQATSSAPVYFLEFAYESWLRMPRPSSIDSLPGVGHGDDLLFLVVPLSPLAPITPNDQLTIDRYTTLIANFAKFGNPTPQVSIELDQQWQPVYEDEFHYLILDTTPVATISPHEAAMALWENIYTEALLDRPIVQTAYGLVRGTHDEEGVFSSFTGIRYAQAPTGQQRFTDPLPASSWDGIFDANQNDIYCPQSAGSEYLGTEDCLTLNVFVPDTASTTNPLAVIVFIHGGAYVSGSNSIYGPDYLMERDVVLVTINFRVGLLGLLCLGHELAPGNVAFKDQIAALRWVQGNIAAFGGDPNSVTILGHSSGAASVDLHTLSPLASGLFTQAVSLSASSRAIWAVNPDPIGTATTLAQRFLNYDGDSIDELVQVYLDADLTILALAASQDLLGNMDGSLLVGACVEDPLSGVEPFLTDTPANILATGAYTPVPIIYGVTSREYLTMISEQEILDIDNMIENLVDYIPADLSAVFNYQEQRAEFVDRVRQYYVTDERSNLESYIDYVSDGVFYYGIVRAARERQATSSAPVYFLEFAYESWLRMPRPSSIDSLPGVGHGDDLLFLVVPLSPLVPITPNDQLTIDRYTTLIANFAKFGNPTPQVSIELDQKWQPVYEDEFHYLILDTTPVATISPHEAAMALWENIYTEALLDRPIVQTSYGLVRGSHDEEGGFSSFTGIRYAQAPTGQLRFTDPLPASSWDGIFDANQNDIYCPQSVGSEYMGTENCLTLNVFVPDTASPTNPLAVIVFVHGGAYVSGSNSIYGPDHLMEHDVVLVTINFRLGLLGLLCLGHELAPGNVAFKDQIAALRWVQGNIAAFGGDPNSVTILGHSSGAASVDLLTLSPLASGLFTQAVSLSASSRAIWAVNPDPIGTATTLAQRFLNYNGDSIDELVQVYLDADPTILALAASQDLLGNMDGSLLVGACVEEPLSGVEPFLTDTPANILATGAYTPVPIIYGVTSREYLTMISEQEILDIDDMIENLVDYIPADLSAVFNYQEQRAEFVDRVRQYYVTDERSNLESYIDYVSDGVFYYGIVRAARERQATSSAPVYFLEFAYESWLRLPRPSSIDNLSGVGHGDDLLFLVFPLSPLVSITSNDQLTIDRYTTLIANFAKFGNPTPQVSIELNQQWQPVYEDEFHYLILDTTPVATLSPHEAAMALWENIYTEALLDRPIVQTAHGLVRGTHDEEGGFSSFTGIRYAQAPTGQLRFTGPLAPPSWTGIFEANQDDIYCPQRVNNQYVGTEDCLTLNIYTPDTASTTNRAAVMFYIHGRSYDSGSNTDYGPDHLISKDVILVTINFRMGAFGLLCLGHDLAPGNAGLKDQVAALRWVQENIGGFGGDPSQVTIIGQSTGAASVDLLTLSHMAQGLFHRAISLSGSSRTPWAVSADPVGYATTLARRYLNYNSDNLADLVQLYVNTGNAALATATYRYSMDLADGTVPFSPCVEDPIPGIDAFLTDTPANILQSGEYTSVPIIYTTTSKEYVNLITTSDIATVSQLMNNIGNYLPNDLVFQSDEQEEETINQIREFYFNSGVTNMEGYIDFMSDTMIHLGVIRAARERQVMSTEPIYLLEFTYESELRWSRINQVSTIRGVGHADDLLYLVVPTPDSMTATDADQLTIDRYTTLFSNFAKYGNPTPQTRRLGTTNWSPVSVDSLNYLDLGEELTTSQGTRAAAIDLWDQAYVDTAVTPGPPSSANAAFSTAIYIIAASLLLAFRHLAPW